MDWKIYRFAVKIEAQTRVEKIVGNKVPEGHVLEVTKMSVTNITAHEDNLELGYIDAGGEDRVICMDNGATKHHHHITGQVWLMAGEQPYGRITTAADGDDCYFICHGKLWPVK